MALAAVVLTVGEDVLTHMNFTSELPTGVLIAGTPNLAISSKKVDGTVSELAHTPGVVDPSNKIVQHSVSNIITNNIDYVVSISVDLDNGDTFVGTGPLFVKDKANPKVAQ